MIALVVDRSDESIIGDEWLGRVVCVWGGWYCDGYEEPGGGGGGSIAWYDVGSRQMGKRSEILSQQLIK